LLAGHNLDESTTVVVCDHVATGSEVRIIHVDEDGLCFQCGRTDDDPKFALIYGLDCLMDRPGLSDVPEIPINHVAYREEDGSWTVERQPDED